MGTFFPRDPNTLTMEERINGLLSLLFLKEKAMGEIKGRKCVNGVPQWAYIWKEDATSPTMAINSMFITGVSTL